MRFLVSANKIDEAFCATLPDNNAKLMLLAAIVAKLNDAPLNVSQAMHLRRIGSSAKNHRKINDLLALGLIELNHDEGNRRTKFLIPTQTALNVFDELALTLSPSLAAD